ncbi:unnamed protein product [Moneuplotes crassus]|uniref:Uncharacterized protein n=1 Tax=Euplotes crassus TaxID=5936 RepID=A0AAD2D9K6_EUPCR|nr:unnamed protein product [Moneuplotes crassus]
MSIYSSSQKTGRHPNQEKELGFSFSYNTTSNDLNFSRKSKGILSTDAKQIKSKKSNKKNFAFVFKELQNGFKAKKQGRENHKHRKDNDKIVPKKGIMRKINYYMTPYMKDLTFKKYMDFEHSNLSVNCGYKSQSCFRKIELNRKGQRVIKNYKLNNLSPGWVNLTDFILNEKKDIFRASVNSIHQRMTKGITQVKKNDKKDNTMVDSSSSNSSSVSFRLRSVKRRSSIKKIRRIRKLKYRSKMLDPSLRLSHYHTRNIQRQTLLNLRSCSNQKLSTGDRFKSFLEKLNQNKKFHNIPILEEAKEKESSKRLIEFMRQETMKKKNLSISDPHSISSLNESDEYTPRLKVSLLKDSCEKLKNLNIRQFSPIETSTGNNHREEKDIQEVSPSPKASKNLKMLDSKITGIDKRRNARFATTNNSVNKDLCIPTWKNSGIGFQLKNMKSELGSNLEKPDQRSTKQSTYYTKMIKSPKFTRFIKITKTKSTEKESLVDKILKKDHKIQQRIRNFHERKLTEPFPAPKIPLPNPPPSSKSQQNLTSPPHPNFPQNPSKSLSSHKTPPPSNLHQIHQDFKSNLLSRFANCSALNKHLFPYKNPSKSPFSPRSQAAKFKSQYRNKATAGEFWTGGLGFKSRRFVKSVENLTMMFV